MVRGPGGAPSTAFSCSCLTANRAPVSAGLAAGHATFGELRTVFCPGICTTSSCCFCRVDLTARIACRFLYWTICRVISAFQPSSCGHLKSISFPSVMTTVKYTYLPFRSTQSTVFMLAKWSSLTLPASPPPPWCCWWSCCLGGSSSTPSSVRTQCFFFQSCSSPSLRFSSRPSLNTFLPFSSMFTRTPRCSCPSWLLHGLDACFTPKQVKGMGCCLWLRLQEALAVVRRLPACLSACGVCVLCVYMCVCERERSGLGAGGVWRGAPPPWVTSSLLGWAQSRVLITSVFSV